jgi:hypothetical protein
MSNKAASNVLTAIIMALVQKILRGRIVPTIIGAAIGAGIGYQAWQVHNSLMPACTFLGLVVGAAIAAAIFPRPQSAGNDGPPESQVTDSQSGQ